MNGTVALKKIDDGELNKILLYSVPNLWDKQAYIQKFNF